MAQRQPATGAGDAARSVLVWAEGVDPELVRATSAADAGAGGRGQVVHAITGDIVAANTEAATLVGLTLDQLLGRTSRDPRWAAVSETGQPLSGDAHPAMVTLSTGRPVDAFLMGVHVPQGSVGAAADGPMNRWLLIDSAPLGGHGGLLGALVVFADATSSPRGLAATDRLLESYRLLAENSTDVTAVGTNAGTLDWVSPSVVRLLGWLPEQMVGRAFRDFVDPDDLPVVAAAQEAILRGEVARFQLRLRTVEGGLHWVSVLLRPVLDDAGEVVGRVAGWRDFESEHAKSAALEASEARYRLLADNATDVIALADADRTITWVSPSVTTLLGWHPAEMVGHLPTEFVYPDDLEEVAAARQALLTGHAMRAEARVRTADGSYRWVATAARPVLDDSGQVTAVVATWRDVEAEHAERDARLESEERYRLLAENASDVVYRIGTDGLVSWISPTVSTVLGWQVEELLGTSMYDLIHVEDRPRIDEQRDAVLRGEDISTPAGGWTSRFRRKDGGYTWLSLKTTVIHDGNGTSSGAVVGMRNVDDLVRERRNAEYEAERRQAILDTLLDPHVLLEAVRSDAGEIVDFVYADANEAACAYDQVPREALIGARLLELLPGQAGSGMLAMYAAAVESEEPLVLDDYAYPHEIVGSERRFDIRAVRVGDALSLTWRDVTDRFSDAQRIAESEERYRLLAENATDVVIRSRGGLMRWLSPSITSVLGWEPSEWIDHPFEDFTHPDDHDLIQQRRSEVQHGSMKVLTPRLRGKDGAYHWVEVHAGPFTDANGHQDGMLATFRVVDAEVAAQQELQRLARFDALTGLLNREEVLGKLGGLSRSGRLPGRETAVLFCDVDDFKDVNDNFGHAAGDEVLRTLAQRIGATVRDTDYVARIGGDEFLLVLTAVHGIDEASGVAEKLRAAAALPVALDPESVTPTLSIGVTLTRPGEGVDDLVARADRAMYEAKQRGRNRVVSLT